MSCLLLAASGVTGAEPEVRALAAGEAIGLALAGNRDLAALELDLNGRALAMEDARNRFAFNLRPLAGATVQDTTESLRGGLALSRTLPVGSTVEVGATVEQRSGEDRDRERGGTVFVSLAQPLFRDYGLLVNREPIEQADSRRTAARRVLELRKSDVAVQVVEALQGLLREERQAEVEEAAIARYDTLLRLTRARQKQGRATEVEALRVALLKGQAEARRAASREQFLSRQAELAGLLGWADGVRPVPVDEEEERLSAPSREEALAVALMFRLDLAQARHDLVDARRGVRIAEHRLQPALAVVARYERSSFGAEWDDSWAFDEDGWSVALATDSDLLLRNERLGLRQASLNEASARLRVEDVEALVRRQVDQGLSAQRRAEGELALAADNLALAEQRVALARRLFEKGRVDNTQAADAELEFIEARGQWLNARAEAVVAGYRLWRIMGVLLEAPEELRATDGNGS
jgi:outer membrane protein TolC